MSWAEYIACMGMGVHIGFWWGNLKKGDRLEDPNVDGRILKWIFREVGWGHELD